MYRSYFSPEIARNSPQYHKHGIERIFLESKSTEPGEEILKIAKRLIDDGFEVKLVKTGGKISLEKTEHLLSSMKEAQSLYLYSTELPERLLELKELLNEDSHDPVSIGETAQNQKSAKIPDQSSAFDKAQVNITDTPTRESSLPDTATPESTVQKKVTEQEANTETEKQFRASPFTIRAKLLTIISGILAASLIGMIFLATGFFKDVSERRIEANILSLTDVIAQKIELELESLQQMSQFLAIANLQDPSGRYNDLFFMANGNVYLIAIDNSVFINTSSVRERGLDPDLLEEVYQENRNRLTASSEQIVIDNVSPFYGEPLLAIGFPVTGMDSTVHYLLDPASMLASFETADLALPFLVNAEGDVIAHPDSDMVVSRSNLLDLPIVETMLESAYDNGSRRYYHDDEFHLGFFKKIDPGGHGIIATVREEVAFAEVYSIQKQNFYITGIVLAASVLFIYFFAKTLSSPIRELVTATKKVEQADYNVEIKPRSGDEIGLLTDSFVRMARGLHERERIKDAFGRFVNKEIAEKASKGELKLGGEKKECAIFFSDLRNFTAMSEKMQPEEVVEYLNEYLTLMVDCINKTGGIVDKFIGDAIMATWGAITTTGKDTEQAVDAALMMRNALLDFNVRNQELGRPLAAFGCGINTGPVISGQIGSMERLEYTVIGDAVNLASRVETLNKPFASDILISEDSYRLVKDIFHCAAMPAIKVKGKEKEQTIYYVLGRKNDPESPTSVEQARRIAGIQPPEKPLRADEEEKKYEIVQN